MSAPRQTVYLHIGRGKTGTTALQRALARSRDALLQRGVYYPAAAGGGAGHGHDGFSKAFIDEVPYYMRMPPRPEAGAEAVRDEICGVQASAILISAENLELANPGKVRQFFESIRPDFNFKVILFVRSQDELAEAEYNQLVKLGRSTQSFRHFSDVEFHWDFLSLAEQWEAVFGTGSVSGHIYDAAHPQVVAQLLDSLGLDGDGTGWLETERTNSSVGLRALTAIRLLSMTDIPEQDKLYAQILQGFAGQDTPALYFDAASAARFRARFRTSNQEFARRFLKGPQGMEMQGDPGGRRYSDEARDAIVRDIRALGLGGL